MPLVTILFTTSDPGTSCIVLVDVSSISSSSDMAPSIAAAEVSFASFDPDVAVSLVGVTVANALLVRTADVVVPKKLEMLVVFTAVAGGGAM